eukprot:TRINITY_DN29636_c0_g1_i1.p1 TRINITY_DN29636_c0_g1~~TRINITY_DN29636_c0_g1_i1.p1  ORF type:complete len:101 (-),score=2.28 TRINITY_DN29636_c0_g1_i1:24-326(-)
MDSSILMSCFTALMFLFLHHVNILLVSNCDGCSSGSRRGDGGSSSSSGRGRGDNTSLLQHSHSRFVIHPIGSFIKLRGSMKGGQAQELSLIHISEPTRPY